MRDLQLIQIQPTGLTGPELVGVEGCTRDPESWEHPPATHPFCLEGAWAAGQQAGCDPGLSTRKDAQAEGGQQLSEHTPAHAMQSLTTLVSSLATTNRLSQVWPMWMSTQGQQC